MAGLEAFIPLALGPVTAIVVEAAKRVPVVPFDGRNRASVALALVTVSLGARAGIAWLNGDLGGLDWGTELKVLIDAVIAALVAAGSYSLVKK